MSGFAKLEFAVSLLVVGLAAAASSPARDLSLPLTGNLLGSVVDTTGTPEMGANVQLFNKYERLIAKTLTTPDGRFAFADLPADLYSVRVSLASFLPAARDRIAVKPGTDSVLQIHLATLFSSIELTYALPTGGMSDDWKWVLRSSPATRPVTRLLDEDPDSSTAQLHPRIFAGTHAMVSLSGGDGGLIDSDSAQPDVGTGFVLSTNVMGKNQVQLGGTFGQNNGLGSAMGLCAIYSRDAGSGFGEPPEITFTLSQFALVEGQFAGQSLVGGSGMTGSIPPVRTMSLSVYEVTDPTDNLHIEYGATGESVDYLQHTTRVSPFARATLGLGRFGEVIAAYSDGGRPDELAAHQLVRDTVEDGAQDFGDELSGPVNTLARLPQLSERNGRLELQRTGNYELGYDKTAGTRTYAFSAFHEDVSNGRINVAGDTSVLDHGDLLSDGASMTSSYNVGHYSRNGYLASVDQRVTHSLDLAIAYGRMGGFTGDPNRDLAGWGAEGKFLDHTNHNLASANLRARVPVSGTQISASYGWVETGAVVPRHMFTTQNIYAQPGFNIIFRQPLPAPFGMPGRLELTADLHNLLAQGYLPMYVPDGRKLLIVQSPRAIRGGLNFIF